MNKLSDYLRISEAAGYPGVSPNILRNWQIAGKIAAHRHPVNGYRLFIREELDALLAPLHVPTTKSRRRTATKRQQERLTIADRELKGRANQRGQAWIRPLSFKKTV